MTNLFRTEEERKVVLFDVYQTLIDIDINNENKKINQAKAWENFAKSLEKYGITITPAELMDLNDKQRANFYHGRRNVYRFILKLSDRQENRTESITLEHT